MSDHPPELGPVYAGASGIFHHHGQLWTGTPPEYLDALEATFDFRTDDVWLLSFPRSGTSWTHEVLCSVLYGGDVAALNEAQRRGEISKFQPIEIGIGAASAIAERIARWQALPSPRVIPTHVPPHLFSKRALTLTCRRVYILRDPRDVAVSRYYFHRSNRLLGPYKGTWEEFFECFARGQVTYGSWFEHTRAWWAHAKAHPDEVLVLPYERLKNDMPASLRRLGAFLGRTLSDAAIAAIAEHTSFQSMSANPFTNRANNPIMDFSVAPFLRKGEIGDWRRHVTPEQAARIRALWDQTLRGTGIEEVLSL